MDSAAVGAGVRGLARDAHAVFAHFTGAAGAIAHPAVGGVRVEIGAAIAAEGSLGGAIADARRARSPPAQAALHAPQWLGLVCRFTHDVPHVVVVVSVQRQRPLRQVCPAPHASPQPPQFIASVSVLTHASPHGSRSVGQSVTHAPRAHTLPAGQATPQPPQFAESVSTEVQVPAQSTCAAAHAHAPPRHA